MKIKEVLCYETSDRRIWRTLAQATLWEDFISKKENTQESSPEFNIRSLGEDDHVDKYFNRGV